jgi:hydroxymethylbilane synthase
VVHELGGDCRMPLAALARIEGDKVLLQARLASPDGRQIIDAQHGAPLPRPKNWVEKAARFIIDNGAMRILSQL